MKLPNLHQKGAAYYYVTGTEPRKWIALGNDFPTALRRYERLRAQRCPSGSVGQLIQDWINSPPKTITPQTLHVYKTYAANLTRVFGEMYPDEVTRAHVLQYLDKCPRTTGLHEIMILRRVLERAVRSELIDVNPAIQAKAETPIRAKRDRYISDEEYDAIYEVAAPVLRVAMDLAYATALRPGDLCRIRFADIETEFKTRKTGVWMRWESTDDLRSILDAAKALQGRLEVIGGISKRTVLFERGGSVTPDHLRDLWQKACKAAGVVGAQFRDLRARSASDDPETAQKRLGHATAQMTARYIRGRQVVSVKPMKRHST